MARPTMPIAAREAERLAGPSQTRSFFLKTLGGWQHPLAAAHAICKDVALEQLGRARDSFEQQTGPHQANAPEKPAFDPAKPRKTYPQTPG